MIEEMKNAPTSVPNQSERDCICPVCLENVADTILLPCHHKLCSQCLLDWRGRTARSSQVGMCCLICMLLIGTRCCICRSLITKTIVSNSKS